MVPHDYKSYLPLSSKVNTYGFKTRKENFSLVYDATINGILSEWPPKNSNPHSPLFRPKFLFGPKMVPGQCIEVFQAKKPGLGIHRAHSVEFFVKE